MLKRSKCFLLILIILISAFGTSHGKDLVSSILQLNSPEYTIGTDQDGAMLALVEAKFPDAGKKYFSDKTGGYAALLSGKIDAFIENNYEADYDLRNGLKGVKVLPGSLGDGVKISAGLSKTSSIPGLEEKFNSFIERSKSDGTIDDMIQRWVYSSAEMPEIDVPEKSDVRLVMGTTGLVVPFSFYVGNKITGFDVELARRFAASIEAELEIKVYDFGGLLMALSTGEVDVALSNLYYSRENSGSLKFSDVLYTVEPVVIVREDMYSSFDTGKFSAFSGKRIGVFTGSVQYEMVKKNIPGAEIAYFDVIANVMNELTFGKIDAAALDETIATEFERANPDLTHIPETLGDSETAFLFPKSKRNNPLLDEMNEYLRRIKSDGTLSEIRAVWSGTDESRKVIPDYSNLPAEKGTIRIAIDNETPMFAYMKDRRLVGYDVDVIVRFCRENGYKPDFNIINFPGIIPAVSSGKCDIGAGGITVTTERAESVRFSEPLYSLSSFLVVKKSAMSQPVTTKPADSKPAGKRPAVSDFDGKVIAVNSGTLHPDFVMEVLPHAKLLRFDGDMNVFTALMAGKADAAVEDEIILLGFLKEHDGYEFVDGYLKTFDNGFIFGKNSKGAKLRDEFNEYLRRIKSDGTLQGIHDLWFGNDESRKTLPDYEAYPDTNGVIDIALYAEVPPMGYVKNGRPAGYEPDIAVRFCKERGYRPRITISNFDSVIPSVISGKAQIGMAVLSITEERKESVNFSDPIYTGGSRLIVKESGEPAKSNSSARVPKYSRLSELDGKPIGLQTGVVEWARIVKEILPHSQAVYYNTFADIAVALKSHKIEAFLVDEPVYNLMAAEDSNLAKIDEKIGRAYDVAYCFPKTGKGKKLCDEMSEFIRKIKASGELASIITKWEGSDESAKTIPDYKNFPATNGVITMAIEGGYPPFNYYRGSEIVGSEIDIAARFCEAYGYGLKIAPMAWDAIIPAIASGKYDFGGNLSPSAEREESAYFSEPYVQSRSLMACLKADDKSVPAKTEASAGRPKYSHLSELDGKPIGMQPGIIDWENWVAENLPHSKVQYYNTYPDLASALKTHKIEGFLIDSPVLALMAAEDERLTAIDEPIGEVFGYSFAFAKTEEGKKLCDEMSEFIRKLKANGELDAMFSKWQGNDETVKIIPDFKNLPATNGTLTFAIEGSYPPFNYYKGTNIAGIDVDIAVKFCEAYGYGLNVTTVVWDAMIPGLFSGKTSFVPDFTPSDEHEEAVNFSEPYCMASSVMACLKADPQPAKPSAPRRNLDSFAGKTIAIQTGTASETLVPEKVPSAKLAYYDSLTNQLTALKTGKADALATSLPPAIIMVNEDSSLEIINPPLRETYFYQMFSNTEKGKKLCAEYSAFLKTLWDNGTIDALNDKWLGADESKKTVDDYSSLPGNNGTVRMAVDAQFSPFIYVKDNRIVGHNVDLAVMFCKAKGYSLVIENMTLSGAIASVKTGKSDFSQSMNKTPEREENTIFTSTPTIKAGNVLVALKSQDSDSEGLSRMKLSDFEGKNIGLLIGSDSAKAIEDKIPGVKILFFDSPSHILPSLRSQRIDAFYCAEPTAKNIMQNHHDLTYVPEYVRMTQHTTMFQNTEKGRKLCAEYADFLKTLSDDGTLDNLTEKWITGTDESKQVTEDYSNLPATNGTLTMAVTEGLMPFVFAKENRIQGYDIDLAVLFCKSKGCGLKIDVMNHNGVLSSLETGKCDFSYSVQWTEERDKTVLFSPVPNAVTGSVLVVMKHEEAPSSHAVLHDISDLAGKKVAVVTGTVTPAVTKENVPTAELVYFENVTDTLTALKAGKVDAICTTIAIARFMMIDNDDITQLGGNLTYGDLAPIFPKNEKGRKLCDQYSEFIKPLWDNGTIQKVDEKWFGKDESKRVIDDYSSLPNPNGTLKLAVDLSMAPFAYMKNGKIVGYDVDLAVMFCKTEGYGLEVVPMSFGAMIPALQSGKCDFAASSIARTKEREESVLFSYKNADNGNIFVVMKNAIQQASPAPSATVSPAKPAGDEPSFWDDIASSFRKTFIREDRWKLFAEGITNTMLITVASIFFGMLLGFTAFMFCRTGSVIANVITKFSVWLIKGTPNVVLLMILYYIIFGHVNISGIVVSIIAFTLTFGTSVYRMLTFGTGAVDRGQTEAAYALGFTDLQTFFTVILPQAALHFMPSLREEVTLLIKSTSIVGYIAVQDLTKMGDIVRSRTYEAFFPLIAVALIYFVLAGILNTAVTIVQTRITPSKRKPEDILRGIKTEGDTNHD